MPMLPSRAEGIPAHLDALLFDFDGVILESAGIKTEAFRSLFSTEPDYLPDIIALHERLGGINREIKFEMIYRDILNRPLSSDSKMQLAKRFADLVWDRVLSCPMVSGAEDILSRLKGLLPMVVVSGTPDKELKEIVAGRDIDRYFVEIHGSPPSKAEIIGGLLVRQGWKPGRVVLVGDAWSDFEAARESGVGFIGRVTPGCASPFPSGTAVIPDLIGLDAAINTLYQSNMATEG